MLINYRRYKNVIFDAKGLVVTVCAAALTICGGIVAAADSSVANSQDASSSTVVFADVPRYDDTSYVRGFRNTGESVNSESERQDPDFDASSFGSSVYEPNRSSRRRVPTNSGVLNESRQFALDNDPGRRGSFRVTRSDYDRGDTASTVPFSVPIEFRGSVWYPRRTNEALPLIVILHGRHETVFVGNEAGFLWPPTDDAREIPSYLGHSNLARHLAGHGFVVASIAANGIALDDFGAQGYPGQVARARLVQEHLRFLTGANAGTEMEGILQGRIDLENIGLLGHSRGAEAMLVNSVINNGDASVQLGPSSTFEGARDDQPEFDIDAVFAIAPSLIVDININDVPLAVMAGYADGDVAMQGVKHYEASLYNRIYSGGASDAAPKHLIMAMGANHNFYNSIWEPGNFPAGTSDDVFNANGNGQLNCHTDSGAPNNGRFSGTLQRDVAEAYATGFFETYLKGETNSQDILTGATVQSFPSLHLGAQDVLVSYNAPDDVAQRFDINRFDSLNQAFTSTGFGTDVIFENVSFAGLAGGPRILSNEQNGGTNPAFVLFANEGNSSNAFLEPHSRGFGPFGAGTLRVIAEEESPARIIHTFPESFTSIANFDAIQFRLGVHFESIVNNEADSLAICEARDNRNTRGSRLLTPADANVQLVLTDANGNSQGLSVSDYSAAAFIPPGLPLEARAVINQVRIPIEEFTQVDITNLTQVIIEVAPNQDVQISDLAITSQP